MRIAGLKLTFASRILAGYLLVFGIASWVFYDSLIEEIKPVVRQSAESALIDTANIIAELVATDVARRDFVKLTETAGHFKQRQLNAVVWEHLRTNVILDFYITDHNGIVLFSTEGKDIGADYSQWRDVYLTLNGQYGARSSLANRYDTDSTVMHVAAPIFYEGRLIGVVTVYNPNKTMQPFIEASRKKVLLKWLLVLFASGLIALLLSFWLSRAIARLARYAQLVQQGETPEVPQLLGSELNQLAQSLEQMRLKLEGKGYVEHYVQTLTHELKSPLAAIRGAAEMLQEDLPADVKTKFLANINEQNLRMQRTIDQLLRLSVLENQQAVTLKQTFKVSDAARRVLDIEQPKCRVKNISIELTLVEDFQIVGDMELFCLALSNVIDNALAFSPEKSRVTLTVENRKITIFDEGAGIPEYALEKVGTRFFSLPRPNGQPKSTGLGLALTREICRMHDAKFFIRNGEKSGAVVVFEFSS